MLDPQSNIPEHPHLGKCCGCGDVTEVARIDVRIIVGTYLAVEVQHYVCNDCADARLTDWIKELGSFKCLGDTNHGQGYKEPQ